MKFDDLDKAMRVYETSDDVCVIPGVWIVARIDGRGFTRLTKEVMSYERPFDARFRDAMVATVRHLMACGFRSVYGYTQSDEISLLIAPDDTTFNRKTRKLNSVLAGEASARFTFEIQDTTGAFDCRLCQLPGDSVVVDYFRWRQADAHRNSLGGHCYWMLRGKGESKRAATRKLEGMSIADKNELLFENGINFNTLPSWQKNGVGVSWCDVERIGVNPLTGIKTNAKRRVLEADFDLPYGEPYSGYIAQRLEQEAPND